MHSLDNNPDSPNSLEKYPDSDSPPSTESTAICSTPTRVHLEKKVETIYGGHSDQAIVMDFKVAIPKKHPPKPIFYTAAERKLYEPTNPMYTQAPISPIMSATLTTLKLTTPLHYYGWSKPLSDTIQYNLQLFEKELMELDIHDWYLDQIIAMAEKLEVSSFAIDPILHVLSGCWNVKGKSTTHKRAVRFVSLFVLSVTHVFPFYMLPVTQSNFFPL
jgi:hypothetical protein